MGRTHAEMLAQRGARLVVSDAGTNVAGDGSDGSAAEATVGAIRDRGGIAVPHVEDLATEQGARGAVRTALDSFGRIDAVIHNAGFTLGSMPFEREQIERLDKLLAINIRAAFVIVQEAWPAMLQ